MKISRIIKEFEDFKKLHGDINICYEDSDGRESWVAGWKPLFTLRKTKALTYWVIGQDGYGG